jgi:hypothetical protein
MSISALSFTFVSLYPSQGSTPAANAERSVPPAVQTPCCEEWRPGGQQDPLVQAMMTALRTLGFGGPPAQAPAASPEGAAPAVTTASATPGAVSAADPPAQPAAASDTTPAQPASAPSANVESAVHQFAHALFQALREGSNPADAGTRKGEGEHGRRHHEGHDHGHHYGQRQRYGDLSQRLETLAQTLATPAPTAASAPAAESPKDPLLDAFSKLFSALQPQSTPPAETDMAAKLRVFLHTLAQALSPEAINSAQAPQVGGLVDVTA